MRRLVDADELKKALSSKDLITWTYEYGDAIPLDWLMSTIDNAPIVVEDYNTGYQDGLEDGLNDIRPQGEWIKDNFGDRFCSVCGKSALYHEIGLIIESRFCPNCGAEMKKGENNGSD